MARLSPEMTKKTTPRGGKSTGMDALARDLRRRGYLLQGLLGVLRDIRPMCHFGAPAGGPEDRKAFATFLQQAGLHALRRESPDGSLLLTVGRDRDALEEFVSLSERKASLRDTDEAIAMTSRMGELLGYPPCCTRAFVETERLTLSPTAPAPASFPRRALERAGAGPFPFPVNFLYNFHSRSSGPSGELGLLLQGGYSAMDRHLLPWIPCGFRCEPSRSAGARLYGALQECEPAFAEDVKRHLATTIVAMSDWAFVPLLGVRRRAEEWYYGATLPVRTLAPRSTVELLASGDRLRRDGGGLEVLRGEALLGRLAPLHVVYDFADEP